MNARKPIPHCHHGPENDDSFSLPIVISTQ
jgi:hypothetical protein